MNDSIRPPRRPRPFFTRAARACCALAPALLVALAGACASPADAGAHGASGPGGASGPVARQSAAVVTASSNMTYGGGSVISNVHAVPVFWTASVAATTQSEIQCFFDAVVRSPYIDWLSEYDTSSQRIGRGTTGSPVTIAQPVHPSLSLTDDDLQGELRDQIRSGLLPAPDNDTVYMIYFPPGYSLDDGSGGHSCGTQQGDFCGYHKSFAIDGQLVRYGVIPDPTCAACNGHGGDFFANIGDNSSHELLEAVTDPDPPSGWYGSSVEIGDGVCDHVTVNLPGTFYTVQELWSNARGQCFAPPPSAGPAQVDTPVLDVASSSAMVGPLAPARNATLIGRCFANPTGDVQQNFSSAPIGVSLATSSFNHLEITIPPSPIGQPGDATLYLFNQGGPLTSTPYTYTSAITPTVSPGHGPMQGGTSVTIKGGPFPTALGAPIGVWFGGVAATGVQCTDPYTCIAVPPAHDPGAVNVTLNVNGVTEAVRNQYVYDGPQISSVQPSHGPYTGGTAVTVTAIDMAYVSQTAWLATAIVGNMPVQALCNREGSVELYEASCQLTVPGLTALPSNPVVDIRIWVTTAAGTLLETALTPADQFTYEPLPSLSSLSFSEWDGTVTASLALDGNAPSGGSLVSLALAPGSPAGVVQLPATVTVPAQSMAVTFPVTVLNTSDTSDVSIVATYGGTVVTGTLTAAMIQATALPPIVLATSTDLPFTAGMTNAVTVTLGTPAPANGAVVALASSKPSYLSVPASGTVTVPAGATTASFTVTSEWSGAPTDVNVTASYAGASTSLNVGVGYLPHVGGSSGCGTKCQ